MKRRLVLVAVSLLAGCSVWWALSRKALIPSATENAPAPNLTEENEMPRRGTGIARDQQPDATSQNAKSLLLPGPVEPKAKPVALASAENAREGPEIGEPGSGLTPVVVLENLRSVFRQYNLRFGANPVGDNAEITASLNGQNPRQVNFLNSDDGLHTNDRGELIDNWGTPFFFHQLSRTEMEIHSAGPDRRMWSQDDLVLK